MAVVGAVRVGSDSVVGSSGPDDVAAAGSVRVGLGAAGGSLLTGARSVSGTVTVPVLAVNGFVGVPSFLEDDLMATGRRKVGFIGDSITIGNGTSPGSDLVGTWEDKNSAPTYAMFGSARQSWDLLINAGVSGETSTEILSRVVSEIVDTGCDICVITSYTWNDVAQSIPIATSMANLTSMLDLCIANSVLPILCTPTPGGTSGSSSTSDAKTGASQRRRKVIELGRSYNIPVVDLFTPLADVTTGALSASYLGAGNDMHPNPTGYQVMGTALAAALDRVCVGAARSDIAHATDADDVLAGTGFFLTDSNADGISNGWTSGGASATFTRPTDGTLGTVQRIEVSGTVTDATLGRTITIVPDHVYEISGYMTKSGTCMARISVNPTSSGNRRVTVTGTDPDVTRAQFSVRWKPSGGDTSATFFMVGGAGTGFVEYGRLTLRDLTALDLT